ncbi:hypothetical protein IHE44_0001282 [Lamprotornis superbus]|uniref:Uncharacterized protein n=1 Tax=Lamprotornis superbus TaxID=245042 RepID=A0A835NRW4_9PASS|nr:hypothetical protein IHE44_0001282 [Lamprotornis superbus]
MGKDRQEKIRAQEEPVAEKNTNRTVPKQNMETARHNHRMEGEGSGAEKTSLKVDVHFQSSDYPLEDSQEEKYYPMRKPLTKVYSMRAEPPEGRFENSSWRRWQQLKELGWKSCSPLIHPHCEQLCVRVPDRLKVSMHQKEIPAGLQCKDLLELNANDTNAANPVITKEGMWGGVLHLLFPKLLMELPKCEPPSWDFCQSQSCVDLLSEEKLPNQAKSFQAEQLLSHIKATLLVKRETCPRKMKSTEIETPKRNFQKNQNILLASPGHYYPCHQQDLGIAGTGTGNTMQQPEAQRSGVWRQTGDFAWHQPWLYRTSSEPRANLPDNPKVSPVKIRIQGESLKTVYFFMCSLLSHDTSMPTEVFTLCEEFFQHFSSSQTGPVQWHTASPGHSRCSGRVTLPQVNDQSRALPRWKGRAGMLALCDEKQFCYEHKPEETANEFINLNIYFEVLVESSLYKVSYSLGGGRRRGWVHAMHQSCPSLGISLSKTGISKNGAASPPASMDEALPASGQGCPTHTNPYLPDGQEMSKPNHITNPTAMKATTRDGHCQSAQGDVVPRARYLGTTPLASVADPLKILLECEMSGASTLRRKKLHCPSQLLPEAASLFQNPKDVSEHATQFVTKPARSPDLDHGYTRWEGGDGNPYGWGNGVSCICPPGLLLLQHRLCLDKLLCDCEPSSEKLLLTWLLLPESTGLQREHCSSVLSPCQIPLARGRGSGQLPESECGDKEKQKDFGRQRYTVTLGTSKEDGLPSIVEGTQKSAETTMISSKVLLAGQPRCDVMTGLTPALSDTASQLKKPKNWFCKLQSFSAALATLYRLSTKTNTDLNQKESLKSLKWSKSKVKGKGRFAVSYTMGPSGAIAMEGLSATCLSIQNQPHINVLVNNFALSQRSLDICINAPKCLLALLPLIFDRRFTVSMSRDPPSLFSLIAQLAFHGPLWQLQPLRKAEVIPPLLFQPCIEEEVCGRDSMQRNVNARSGLSHGNQYFEGEKTNYPYVL